MLSADLTKVNYEPGCLIGNFSSEMSGNAEFQTRLSQTYADWSLALAARIDEAKSLGQVKADTPAQTLGAFLVTAWEGAVLRAKVERDGAALDDFEQVVFTGLSA
jgi:TetR/AcrR family transcriptional repressor of nem operon